MLSCVLGFKQPWKDVTHEETAVEGIQLATVTQRGRGQTPKAQGLCAALNLYAVAG